MTTTSLAFIFGGSPGAGELLVILAAALLLFGSKRLPGIARSLGRAMEELRRAAREVSDEFHRAADEPMKPPGGRGDGKEKEKEQEGESRGGAA